MTMTTSTGGRHITAQAAAEELGLDLAGIYRLVDAGELTASRDDRGHIWVDAAEVAARRAG